MGSRLQAHSLRRSHSERDQRTRRTRPWTVGPVGLVADGDVDGAAPMGGRTYGLDDPAGLFVSANGDSGALELSRYE